MKYPQNSPCTTRDTGDWMSADGNGVDKPVSIGRIPLKQVRVKRPEGESTKSTNPMNALVPYLDLFCRLDDNELARLAQADVSVVAELRAQVVAIDVGLSAYTDLLPRLADEELVRLTGATPKTIRFWRLCQPRVPHVPEGAAVARAAKTISWTNTEEPDTFVEDESDAATEVDEPA